MLSLNNQLDTMTANYDLARKEANALKEENMKLKEEGSLMVTNIHSIKDSNLKLHEDKEELYEKISGKCFLRKADLAADFSQLFLLF